MKYHYVYRITNILFDKHYYGVRSTKLQPKEDLGKKYFSSSSNKEFIKDQKENPENYKYKVIKICKTRHDASKYEIKLHAKFDVKINEKFYNKANATSIGWDRTGCKNTRESIKQMIETKRKNGTLNQSIESIEKISNTMKGRKPNNYGKKRSLEAIKKAAKSNKGKKRTKEQCKNISESLKGRKLSEEHKAAVSKNRKGKLCGSENPSASKINIYNSKNELIFECYGNFRHICDENMLPSMALTRSYRNDGKPLYESDQAKTKAKANNNEKFIGWYAIKL